MHFGVFYSAHVDPWSLTHVAFPLHAKISSMVYGAFTFILLVTCGVFASQEQSAGQLGM